MLTFTCSGDSTSLASTQKSRDSCHTAPGCSSSDCSSMSSVHISYDIVTQPNSTMVAYVTWTTITGGDHLRGISPGHLARNCRHMPEYMPIRDEGAKNSNKKSSCHRCHIYCLRELRHPFHCDSDTTTVSTHFIARCAGPNICTLV